MQPQLCRQDVADATGRDCSSHSVLPSSETEGALIGSGRPAGPPRRGEHRERGDNCRRVFRVLRESRRARFRLDAHEDGGGQRSSRDRGAVEHIGGAGGEAAELLRSSAADMLDASARSGRVDPRLFRRARAAIHRDDADELRDMIRTQCTARSSAMAAKTAATRRAHGGAAEGVDRVERAHGAVQGVGMLHDVGQEGVMRK